MNEKINNLTLCSITQDQHKQTCGYWYLIQHNGMAHTAFATKRGLYRWLMERGLKLSEPLPVKRGVHSHQKIIGCYELNSYIISEKQWKNLPGVFAKIKKLSNGDYTEGKLTMNKSGDIVVNYLNPNCHYRKIYDYAKCDERRHVPTEEQAA